MSTDYPFTLEEFNSIYSRVPRLTVEVIVKNSQDEVFLVQRAIEPCKGQWHLPGGTVFFGELLLDAVKRVVKREIGIEVETAQLVGYIEYPSHFKNGLDSPVGIAFEVSKYTGGVTTNHEGAASDWFKVLPQGTHAEQDTWLIQHGYLKEN